MLDELAVDEGAQGVEDDRRHLRHEVEHAGHALAGQGPISTFIHHNTLHGFEHLPFEEATLDAERVLGGRCYLPPEANRAHHAAGRITDADLAAALSARPELAPDEVVASAGGREIRAGEIYRAHLVHGVEPTDPARLRFEARELDALARLRADVPPEQRERILARSAAEAETELARVGQDGTLAHWLGGRTGLDVVAFLRRSVQDGQVAPRRGEDGEGNLAKLGIPPARRPDYLRCVDRALAGVGPEGADRDALRSAWLRQEVRVVDKLARRHLGVRGTFPALAGWAARDPERLAVGGLWRASLDLYALADPLSPTDPGHLLAERDADGGALESEWQRLTRHELSRDATVPQDAGREELERLGRDRTHAEALRELTGVDVARRVDEIMIRLCGAFLDEGQSAWRMPDRGLGFYTAWRRLAQADRTLDVEGVKGWREALDALPERPEDAVLGCLEALGVQRADWGEYVRRLLLALPGWAGLIAWREGRPDYPRQRAQPVDLASYVAVRLFHETLLVRKLCAEVWATSAHADALRRHLAARPHELLVRRAVFAGRLPEHLAAEARDVVEVLSGEGGGDDAAWRPTAERLWLHERPDLDHPEPHGAAWRLFGLAQLLGLSPGELGSLSPEARDRVMAALDALPERRHGPVWLAAFERHYANEILNAVAANRGRGRWLTREERPKAQTVFCIDEREEALRRHLEEVDPGHETFGTAGFFGIAMNYEALDDHAFTPLCPMPAMAVNTVVEQVREGDEPKRAEQKELVGWADVFHNAYWEAKRNSVSAYFLYDLIAAFVAVPLFGKILSPRRYTKASLGVKDRLMPPVRTRLTLNAEQEGHGLGFTLDQQADKVEATLRNIGLVSGFAPIVLLSGHGSMSANNPHESAHDCGACGGKHGGPNARAFAAMANRPEVRALLRERGIAIPDDTRFVGAIHNTCSERITYLDVEDIPDSHRERFGDLVSDLDEARARSAQERCRRFGSAPKDASPAVSLAHVEARSVDLSQVRPEWGHATNACAFFGRRSLTQGLFLDRRGFLVSYDPRIDPDGTILERIIMAAGPVGAGISLEYYFSTVDNETFGCDTKLPHNVAGLVGVMEGTTSDLRTGLPLQMVEVHEPMRLLLVVDAAPETLGMIYARQPGLQVLIGNEWVHLASVHPDTGEIQVFVPGEGFVPWDGEVRELPEVAESFDWYRSQTDFLPPARIAGDGAASRG